MIRTTTTPPDITLMDYEVTYGERVNRLEAKRIKFSHIKNEIKTSKDLKNVIDEIRACSSKNEMSQLKVSRLAYFSLAEFNSNRKTENFVSTQAFVFDIDNITNINEIRAHLEKWKYSSAVFTSPSGNGLKLIIKLNRPVKSSKEYYELYDKASYYIEKLFEITLDRATKDPARACFLSYDPKIYINEEADSINCDRLLEAKTPTIDIGTTPQKENKSTEVKRIQVGVDEGERYTSMMQYLGALIKKGIDGESTYSILKGWNLLNTPPFSDDEFEKYFSNAYSSFSKNTETSASSFWSRSRSGNITIDNNKFIEFLEGEGFYKIEYGFNSYQLVKITAHIIKKTSTINIQEHVRTYLNNHNSFDKEDVLDKVIKSVKTLFSKDGLNFLTTITPETLKDEKNKAHLCFNKNYVEITPNEIKVHDYSKLDGYLVWDSDITTFDLSFHIGGNSTPNSEFDLLCKRITKNEEQWYNALVGSIGYMVHSYKDPANAKAIILCDAEIPVSSEANGGTGKSLFSHGIKMLKKTTVIDGKNYKGTTQFNLQNIDVDTKSVILDDVRQDFDFESLLSGITSDLIIEKKFRDPITIPYKDAPKFIITTNYTIEGSGNSFDRRKHEVEFSDHYNKTNTPDLEFGHRLFDDWDKEEWNRFYITMILYTQRFIKYGLTTYKVKNLPIRKTINSTCQEFFDFAEDNIKPDSEYIKADLYNSFRELYYEHSHLTSNLFTRWLKVYSENKDFNFKERKSGSKRLFTFKSLPRIEEHSGIDPEVGDNRLEKLLEIMDTVVPDKKCRP